MTIQDFGTLQMMRTNEAHFGQGQMVSLTSKVDGAKINTGIDASKNLLKTWWYYCRRPKDFLNDRKA
jgi:hypothetical protein